MKCQERLQQLIDAGEIVKVRLSPSYPGVDLPWHLRHQSEVTLALCTRGAEANDDLDIKVDGFTVTLRFGTEYHHCRVPFRAVISIGVDHYAPPSHPSAWRPVVIQGGKN